MMVGRKGKKGEGGEGEGGRVVFRPHSRSPPPFLLLLGPDSCSDTEFHREGARSDTHARSQRARERRERDGEAGRQADGEKEKGGHSSPLLRCTLRPLLV